MSRVHETRRSPDGDEYHGRWIADPYRWLEDIDGAETRAWVGEQDARAREHLDLIAPRDEVRARLRDLTGYERWDMPVRAGDRLFAFQHDGVSDQPVFCTFESFEQEPRVLLDPNAWANDGTAAIVGTAPSPDGSMVAYGVTVAGSSWTEWRVVDVGSGGLLVDRVRRIRSPWVSWAPDGSGFYYAGFDEVADGDRTAADPHPRVLFHRIGTDESLDALVYRRTDHPEWGFGVGATEDGRYLIIYAARGHDTSNALFYRHLSDPDAPVVELCGDLTVRHLYIGHDDETFYVMTTFGAPRGRVVAIDLTRPSPDAWRDIVPETDATISWAALKGDVVLVGHMRDARIDVSRVRLDGTPDGTVELPGLGAVFGFGGARTQAETFFAYTDFLEPLSIYRYDVATRVVTPVFRPAVPVDRDAFVVEQVFARSDDGTPVPAFIVRRRDTELDGRAPALVYGYGGFGIPLLPWFSTDGIAWAERGGVYAVANIRGGGEYGDAWHAEGSRRTKPNTFSDFIAVGEWLIENRYAQKGRLAITGGSNGGLLVGACVTKRPDLYAAAHASVGIFDMMRFSRFTVGRVWLAEYGSPEDPDDFEVLIGYSPLHNVRAGTSYPAVLLSTGDHDDHVVPSHTYKFCATLQAAQGSDAPILLRVEPDAGHGMGKPLSKLIDEQSDVLGFLWHHTS